MDFKEYSKKRGIKDTKTDIAFYLGCLILECRLYAGITQTELARRIGTRQPSIARAECGEVEPKISFILKIAKACEGTDR